MRFFKYQAVGNSFVLLDARDVGELDWPALALTLCAHHTGVGADGLLLCLPTDRADVRMRMFNPDGTEDMCGNGLRCVALHAVREGLVPRQMTVETIVGLRRLEVLEEGSDGIQVRAEMGRPALHPAAVPALLPGDRAVEVPVAVEGEEIPLTVLSTGSAHAVHFGPPPDEERFQRLSLALEHHPLFPERVSVMWATPCEAEDCLDLRIWERGVGETYACGTGACATAVAAFLTGRAGKAVEIRSRGGSLFIEMSTDLDLVVTGPAALVLEGHWPDG